MKRTMRAVLVSVASLGFMLSAVVPAEARHEELVVPEQNFSKMTADQIKSVIALVDKQNGYLRFVINLSKQCVAVNSELVDKPENAWNRHAFVSTIRDCEEAIVIDTGLVAKNNAVRAKAVAAQQGLSARVTTVDTVAAAGVRNATVAFNKNAPRRVVSGAVTLNAPRGARVPSRVTLRASTPGAKPVTFSAVVRTVKGKSVAVFNQRVPKRGTYQVTVTSVFTGTKTVSKGGKVVQNVPSAKSVRVGTKVFAR